MSRRRTLIRLSAVLAVAALAKGCGDGDSPSAPATPEPARPTTVTVSPTTHELTALGTTVQLTAEVRDQNSRVMAGATVTWASSAAAVATVDAAGLVTAADNGTATITATGGGVSGTATVTVAQTVSAIAVAPAADTLVAGDTLRLAAEATDANGHAVGGAEFTWASGDTAVAVVDATGLVTGVGAGEVEITATAAGVAGRAMLVVVGSRVTLDSGEGSAPEGGVVTLGLTVDPVPEQAISVRYTLGADGDPVTADADAVDYTDGGGGAVDIAAGASSAAIEIAINDDAEIESAREVFTVTLDTPGSDAGYGLGLVATAAVTIEEGVCDRTPQVGDEIVQQAGVGDCVRVEDRHLASIHGLDLCFPKEEWLGCEREDILITELREGDFLGLSGLEWLNLTGNDLTELPEGIFSGPSSLFDISLLHNRLAELPAGIFAGLSHLRGLALGINDLTALPEGVFSDLISLEWLGLESNDLTALPEGVFSGLASLNGLNLNWNLGSPFTLTVQVTRTDSSDPMSPGPATLGFRVAEGVPFAMTIPLSARGGTLSTGNVSFAAGATVGTEAILTPDGSGAVSVAFGPVPTVCEAPGSNTEGPKCSGLEIVAGDPLVVANPETVALSVPAAHLTQASQDLSGGVPLIAGRDALLRVFATADERYIVGHEGQATFLVRGREVYSASLKPPASGIPVDVEEGRLVHSFNARIPGHVLEPGLEVVVELDPDGALPLKEGSSSRFPATGRLALDVREVPPMNLTIVPVLYHTEARQETNRMVEDIARDMAGSDSYGVIGAARGMLPIGDLNVRLREPHYSYADTVTVTGHDHLHAEIAMLRHLEAGGTNEYYHGIFFYPHGSDWPLGLGQQPGYTATSGFHPWESPLYRTFAHELGHNLSLWHARCDGPKDHPAYFPYPDGSIGAWGHRFTAGDDTGFGQLLNPEIYVDVMRADECPNWRGSPQPWLSDTNFNKALDHRLDLASAEARFAQSAAMQETLLLWGGVHEGNLRLEPAFAHDARLKLPEAPGPYRLEGLDAEGRRLFSFSFTPDALEHGSGSFLFAVPFQPEWTEDLDRITLTGPQGLTTLDRDTGGRAALIIDRASGRVRTIARDWSVGNAASAAAMAAEAQVEVIRGLPRR